jgi:hypothetical protein
MLSKENSKQYIGEICECVRKAQQNNLGHTLVYESTDQTEYKNEFICFVKPGITLENKNIKLAEIMELVLDTIGTFGLWVKNIKILPGPYLEQYDIMAQHYGVINKLSTHVRESINEQGIAKFEEMFGLGFDNAEVYGGHEFLEKFPKFNAYSLSVLWQSTGFSKLTSGTYAGKFSFDGSDYYLVNGFHPLQLNHFNMPGRSIVVLSLCGNLDWGIARNDLIGLTDPSKAKAGSIRHEMFKNKEKLGIPIMNTAYNGVHLSAGPVEALNELIRFNSDFTDPTKIKKIDDYKIGRLLLDHFNPEQINHILNNEKGEDNGSASSFDLTEEKNTGEMMGLLKAHYA